LGPLLGPTTARERQLADLSVGAAGLAAQQTAAGDLAGQLVAGTVANHGTIVAIGEARHHGDWIVVTEEQSIGTGPYTGLPPGLHVTVTQVTHLRSGWAVSSWRPSSWARLGPCQAASLNDSRGDLRAGLR
jgi:hypothetical protein